MTINLLDRMDFLPGVVGSTAFGNFVIELFPDDAPLTVENFLTYVEREDYDQVMIHRSVPGFVLQTGGFAIVGTPEGPQIEPVASDPPVPNEFNRSNLRGTVAMAKLGGDPDSATNQWFVNLADNGAGENGLDSQNGGFTVFGEIYGDGMAIFDAIAEIPFFDVRMTEDSPFGQVPLVEWTPGDELTLDNLVLINAMEALQRGIEALEILDNGAPEVVEAIVEGGLLRVQALAEGSTVITVKVTTPSGFEISAGLPVTVGDTPLPPVLAVFSGASDLTAEGFPDWYQSDWFGFFWAGAWPFIYTEVHQWLFVAEGGEPNQAWFWDPNPEVDWIFTSREFFPFFFHAGSLTFWFMDQENPTERWFFLTSENEWRQFP